MFFNTRNLFIIHLLATAYMVGVIWIIQVIHYPLFEKVGRDQFISYELSHLEKTSLVIALPMILEILSFIGLLIVDSNLRASSLIQTGGLCLLLIWPVTFFISVPQHNILSHGFNQQVLDKLILTNWIRTSLWSIRLILLIPFIK